jgi:ADP-dependent NAD(P)H-hydrate dehydratase
MNEPSLTLPPRRADGHKGDFGTVLVVGGQCGRETGRVMVGGPALSAIAAMRAGAGLAVLAMPEPILRAGLIIAPTATGIALPTTTTGMLIASGASEAIDSVIDGKTILAIGPGLGTSDAAQRVVMRLAAREELPMVIDADGLNCLSMNRSFHLDLKAPAVLTPHPGEWDRLAKAVGIAGDAVSPAMRPGAADALAQRLGCVVVLKGAGTVVSDGLRRWVCPAGSAALATGGSGDVLTGVIAGLMAQFGRGGKAAKLSLFECACAGVFVHATAADHWTKGRGDAGMLATDLLEEIPAVVMGMRHSD